MTAISDRLRASEERRLVKRFLSQRSERTFRKLYRHCTPRLYQVVLRLLQGSESEAQEVVQDTWVRAVERSHTFRGESSFRTWLTGIAVRRCQEQFRQRTRDRRQVSLDPNSQYDEAISLDERLDLEGAIAALSDGYRKVLVLHDIEGYTHVEIADMLSIEPGTSKSQLFHARKVLRSKLQPKQIREKPNDKR